MSIQLVCFEDVKLDGVIFFGLTKLSCTSKYFEVLHLFSSFCIRTLLYVNEVLIFIFENILDMEIFCKPITDKS